tara:strand:+ start:26 stop:151 length:126 start_codon:yes stop_codon:yes gene_type:complete
MNIKELLKSTTEPLPQGTLYEIIKAKRIEKKEKVDINNSNN